MVISSLPLEIIIDILSRVAVKDLLRFRCTSKRWCRLIDGPKFIRMHLQQSVETNANHSLILRRSSQLFAADFDSLDAAAELNHPLMCYSSRIKILGVCSGLLCICNIADDIAVWNPATKRYRILPHLSIELKRPFGMCPCHVSVYGFGYEPVADDFKLVRLVQFFGLDRGRDCFECEVMVYSMARNVWKRIDDMPYVLCYSQKIGTFASGALHWVVTKRDELETDSLIVALDLRSETYKEVPLPDYKDTKFDMDVGVLGGCLCMIANFRNVCIDLWVMKKYGVKDSWTQVFSIAQPEVIRSFRFVKPLAYSKSGSQILLEQDKYNLLWYDLENKRINTVKIRGMPSPFEALMLPQTLVPLHPNRRIEEKKRIALENRRKRRDDFLSQGFKLVL